MREIGRETVDDVGGVKGAIELRARLSAEERGIEKDDVEAPAVKWSKEIAFHDLNLIFHPVEEDVDPGAAYGFGVDVNGDDASGLIGGGDGGDAGAGAHVEERGAGRYGDCGKGLRQKLAGAEQFRVEHLGQDENGPAGYLFQDKAIVPVTLEEKVAPPN